MSGFWEFPDLKKPELQPQCPNLRSSAKSTTGGLMLRNGFPVGFLIISIGQCHKTLFHFVKALYDLRVSLRQGIVKDFATLPGATC